MNVDVAGARLIGIARPCGPGNATRTAAGQAAVPSCANVCDTTRRFGRTSGFCSALATADAKNLVDHALGGAVPVVAQLVERLTFAGIGRESAPGCRRRALRRHPCARHGEQLVSRSSSRHFLLGVAAERPRGSELAEAVTDHVLGHVHLQEGAAVVDHEGVTDELRQRSRWRATKS